MSGNTSAGLGDWVGLLLSVEVGYFWMVKARRDKMG
jgi:hypothetical protein